MKLRTLKKHALSSTKHRGHNMNKFYWSGSGAAQAFCKDCRMSVTVEENPAPNSIDISGLALALNCYKGTTSGRISSIKTTNWKNIMTLTQIEDQIQMHRSLLFSGSIAQQDEHYNQIFALQALARPLWAAERAAVEDMSATSATHGY